MLDEVRGRVDSALAKQLQKLKERHDAIDENDEYAEHYYDQLYDEAQVEQIHVPRVMTNSFTLAYVSQIEYALDHLCRHVQRVYGCQIGLKDMGRQSNLESALGYLEKVGGLKTKHVTNGVIWNKVDFYRKVRNSIAHESSTDASETLLKAAKSHGKDIKITGKSFDYTDGYLDRLSKTATEFLQAVKNALPSFPNQKNEGNPRSRPR